jgi:hypothetical protein
MFKVIAAVLVIGQFLLVASGLVWLIGKIGFGPAQPYAAKIESTAVPIFQSIKARF